MIRFPSGSIWTPKDGMPDLAYCACLMNHAAEKAEHSFPEFQQELAANRQLYQNAFTVLRDHLQSLGYDSEKISLSQEVALSGGISCPTSPTGSLVLSALPQL